MAIRAIIGRLSPTCGATSGGGRSALSTSNSSRPGGCIAVNRTFHSAYRRCAGRKRFYCFIVLVALVIVPAANAQVENEEPAKSILPADTLLLPLSGLQIYNITAYSGYSSSPWLSSVSASSPSRLGPDFSGGMAGSIGWNLSRGRIAANIMYSAAYDTGFRYSSIHDFSQVGSLAFRSILTPRWSLSNSGVFSSMSASQLFFPLLTDTSAAASAQIFDPSATGAGAPAGPAVLPTDQAVNLNSPLGMSAYGSNSRWLSETTNLSFKKSARMTMVLGGSITAAETSDTIKPSHVLVPRSLAARGYYSLSYNLSPKTAVGVSSDVQREFAPTLYGSAWTESFGGSVSHILNRHWRVQTHTGLGLIQWLSQNGSNSKLVTVVSGGGISYTAQKQSVQLSYDRSVANSFGYLLGTSDILNASWNWRRSPETWSVLAYTSYERTGGSSYGSFYGITAGLGITRNIGRQLLASLQYVYSHNSGTIQPLYLTNFQGVRLSLSWRGFPLAR